MFLLYSALLGAELVNLATREPPSNLDNIKVEPLTTNQHASQFLIHIKQQVPLHLHKEHDEVVYVLAGSGKMRLGDRTFAIKQGDLISIARNTPHSVIVTSKQPLKVLSTQTPEYFGKDKHEVLVDE